MNRKIGDIVNYTFKIEYRGTVKVIATIIQIYPALYHKSKRDGDSLLEMSIQFDDLGDTRIIHGMLLDDPDIS